MIPSRLDRPRDRQKEKKRAFLPYEREREGKIASEVYTYFYLNRGELNHRHYAVCESKHLLLTFFS